MSRPVRACLVLILAGAALLATSAGAQAETRRLPPQTGVLWAPFQSWTLLMPDYEGQPFDVEASAVFHHLDGDARHVTPLFYAGDGRWSFRFTGTRTGRWAFVTTSPHAALDGWHGEVWVEPNPDPRAHGFLTTVGRRFAVPIDEAGTLEARLYHVYINTGAKNSLGDYATDPAILAREVDEILDEVDAHGFDALFVAMNHNWFAFGADSYADHDSVDPDPTSFAVLETLILRAQARGLGVHIWAWGDEERRWTPIGVGGIQGESDRRLQRTIAARLGPLPGWTMSYGFDLDEWVTPEETRAWWAYLHAHLGWPHLLMARESAATAAPDRVFRFEGERLDVVSSDERPTRDFYAAAVAALDASDVPVMFERRFLHTRDGVWDMDTTRRALWQFTLAGGVGAIWGPLWSSGPAYPDPAQFRTHRDFWRGRWSLDLERAPAPMGDDAGAYVLRDRAGTRTVVYAEGTDALRFDLAHMAGPAPAIAVDTRRPYAPLDVGHLVPGAHVWSAPYASDWVLAVGDF